MTDNQDEEVKDVIDTIPEDDTEEGVTIDEQSDNLLEKIKEYANEKNVKSLKTLLHDIEDMELLYIINELNRKQKAIVFRLLHKDNALFVFEQLDTALQKELIESFTDDYTIEIIEELEPDDRVELLEEMPANVAKRLISSLSPEERKITNILMGYEPETAGRVMTPRFISLRRKMTADEALAKVRRQAKDDKETIYTLYVTDDTKKLEGVITLREILIAEPRQLIEDIMSEKIVKVTTSTDQEEAANALKEFDLLALPVVDKEDRIVGIITVDDAVDILEYEATEDIYNQAGFADITGKETNRSEVLVRGSLWAVWKVRLPFLGISLIAGLLSALVMGGFEDILESIVIVAFFVPLIMDIGGSVGNQSTTLFVRGVALGHIDTKKFYKHLGREVGIGASIGLVVGIITGIIAAITGHFMLDSRGYTLGIAVGVALAMTITIAAFIGFFVPFILLKLKLDQAAGSAPIITAVKDVTSLLIYFSMVSLLLGHLM
ncbi:MAG: magnesium transporter [Firmicutes bacterium]|nr:magnesium transporter [Bacillota bacterium]